jgi:hypothetical protein
LSITITIGTTFTILIAITKVFIVNTIMIITAFFLRFFFLGKSAGRNSGLTLRALRGCARKSPGIHIHLQKDDEMVLWRENEKKVA